MPNSDVVCLWNIASRLPRPASCAVAAPLAAAAAQGVVARMMAVPAAAELPVLALPLLVARPRQGKEGREEAGSRSPQHSTKGPSPACSSDAARPQGSGFGGSWGPRPRPGPGSTGTGSCRRAAEASYSLGSLQAPALAPVAPVAPGPKLKEDSRLQEGFRDRGFARRSRRPVVTPASSASSSFASLSDGHRAMASLLSQLGGY